MKPKNKELLLFISLFIICVVSIFIYNGYLCFNKDQGSKDILNEIDLNVIDLNGWSLTHLFFYTLIGYLFKGNYLIYAFILGLIWEIIEYLYGEISMYYKDKENPKWFIDGNCNIPMDGNYKKWWYSKPSDIMVNTLGLILGSYLRKKRYD